MHEQRLRYDNGLSLLLNSIMPNASASLIISDSAHVAAGGQRMLQGLLWS